MAVVAFGSARAFSAAIGSLSSLVFDLSLPRPAAGWEVIQKAWFVCFAAFELLCVCGFALI